VICKLWKIKEVCGGALISQQLQITEALRRSGINESSTYVLVAHFDGTPDELEATRALVQGSEISLQELLERADHPLILKHYKITPAELEISSLADAITCRIAARDAL
jgi:EKC/KEOPS complex subunit CGI121/TPRKB